MANPLFFTATLLFFLFYARPGLSSDSSFLEPPKLYLGDTTFDNAGTAPEDAILLANGHRLFREENYKEALTHFLKGPAGNPVFALWTGLTYWKLNQLGLAGPYLRQANSVFFYRGDLHRALFEVGIAEIDALNKQKPTAMEEKRLILRQLGQRYEETFQFRKAAEAYESALVGGSDYFSVIHVANLFKISKEYKLAADYFQKAARVSTAPQFALMWTLDCYLLLKQVSKCEELLRQLKSVYSGPDLHWYRARIYRIKEEPERANQVLFNLGEYYEKKARKGDKRINLLNAAKAYLDGNFPEKGLRILAKLRASSRDDDLDIDTIKAEYFYNSKNYQRAIAIYERYPNSVVMQSSLGWGLFYSGKLDEARLHFQKLKDNYPYSPLVREGWNATANLRPWSFFYIFSRLDYGDYQGERDLNTAMVKYAWGRVAGVLSYSNTETHVRPEGFDFGEDLYGAKLYRRWSNSSGFQVHTLHFQSNDYQTDDGIVLGAKYYNFAHPKFHWTSELNSSIYADLSSIQSTLGLTFNLDSHWSTTLKFASGFLSGEESRWAETRTPVGINGELSFQDRNLAVTLAGWGGERILMVDSTGLYAFNSLDTYRQGASFMILQKAAKMDIFLKYGVTHVTSQFLRERNERLRTSYDADYQAKTASIGFDFHFY